MREFQYAGRTFLIGPLTPLKAFHVTRKLGPLVAGLTGLSAMHTKLTNSLPPSVSTELTAPENSLEQAEGVLDALAPLLERLAEAREEDIDYVIKTCLAEVYVQEGKVVTRLWNMQANAPQFPLTMPGMLVLTALSVVENCKDFMTELLSLMA
jgi:hypothetical protein